jgi:hypothetical protein
MGEFHLKTIIIAVAILIVILIAAWIFKSYMVLFLIPVELFIVTYFRDSKKGF